jgi:hypothetical protein
MDISLTFASLAIFLNTEMSQVWYSCHYFSLSNNIILGMQQNMWRFLTLSDPLVDATIFRDMDSDINEREVEAVSEWLPSPYQMHVMRDNPMHDAFILGS